MYSGYALHISVTKFCNYSLAMKTYAAKTFESLVKNKNSWRWILLMTFKKKNTFYYSSEIHFLTFAKLILHSLKYILVCAREYIIYSEMANAFLPIRCNVLVENQQFILDFYSVKFPSYNNCRCVYIYMFISLYFSCRHKHVYNHKKLTRRTIWRGLYRSDSFCGYRFKYLRKYYIFQFWWIKIKYIDQIRIVATALNFWENYDIFQF